MDKVIDNMDKRHSKQLTYMRAYLDGKGYHKALEALEFACRLDEGKVRKDGLTPSFHHQLQVARLATTLLPHLEYPEETITAAFLHDVLEDYSHVVSREMLEDKFGRKVADAVWTLSKKMGGIVKSPESYFDGLARCPIASFIKLCDRIHNLHTMQGAFKVAKQEAYVTELDDWFFPMLKVARSRFPRQYGAYENLKIMLLTQKNSLYFLINLMKETQ